MSSSRWAQECVQQALTVEPAEYVLGAKMTNCLLECMKDSVVSKLKEVLFPLYYALMRPNLEYRVQF